MKNTIHLIVFLLISTAVFGQKQFPTNYKPDTYMPGRIIFKLLPENRSALIMEQGQPKTYRLTNTTLQKICAAQGQYSVKALFPHHWGRSAGKVDLSLIGELEFEETVNVPGLCRQLMATGQFEYDPAGHIRARFVIGGGYLLPKNSGADEEEDYEVNGIFHSDLFKRL